MRIIVATALLVIGPSSAHPHLQNDCAGVPVARAPRAIANDNRVPAGILKDGILTVRLTAREAAWYPDGPEGCGIRVNAFAEEGQAARIPGPLLRVPVGTEIRVILRNSLGESVRIRGLLERPLAWQTVGSARAQLSMDSAAVEIAKDAVREIRFRANVPGTFYYWGIRSTVDTAWQRAPGRLRPDLSSTEDGQLVGALVVDPAGPIVRDRIFVMTHTRLPGTRTVPVEDPALVREVNAINGLSWPYSERLTVTTGDTVRWKVLNPAATSHVMHLHGFYYRVLTRGGVSAFDSALTPARQENVVSEFMQPNRTMTLDWIPETPGNWLFHCHFLVHMSPAQRVARVFGSPAPSQPAASAEHGEHNMAGPILGVTVRARTGEARVRRPAPRRVLRLFANERPGVFGDHPGLGFVLQSGDAPPATDSIRIPGTPLILTRGEPTQITVLNRLRIPLSVHWHGIELESYFDGVPGFSGAPGRVMHAMAPGDSFVVHLTPPRAGTFMYHIHSELFDELRAGLYGPLIVLEAGQSWDPGRDHVFVLSNGGPGTSHQTILVNGIASTDTIDVSLGVEQRLRFIAIPANGEFVLRLRDGDSTVTWKQVARDGADLASEQIKARPATDRLDVGITKDFVFTPDKPGLLLLEVDHRVPGHPTRVVLRVR